MMNRSTRARAKESASTISTASLILALHARWEACQLAITKMEAEEPDKPERDGFVEHWARYHAHKRAFDATVTESCTLRQALLFQAPATDEELSVLAYHATSAADSAPGWGEGLGAALTEATSNIFDYLVSEHRIEMERAGPEFSRDAVTAFQHRHLRNGTEG